MNYSTDIVLAIDYTNVNFQEYVTSFVLEPNMMTYVTLTMVLLFLGVRTLMIQKVKNTHMLKLRMGHLSYARQRKWNGSFVRGFNGGFRSRQ